MKKIIYVADKGMMSHDNIVHILSHGCGYVISDSPRKKQEKDIMDFLYDPSGYKVKMGGDRNSEVVFKYKERTVPMKRSGVTYRGKEDKKTCTACRPEGRSRKGRHGILCGTGQGETSRSGGT